MSASIAGRYNSIAYERWFYSVKSVARPEYHLYCFPFAGGGNTTYREWAAILPKEVEMSTLVLPGRSSRGTERLSTDLTSMSYQIADALQAVERGRYVFFGHSMGAILAYEVTCRLRERGAQLPVHLFVSGRQAPHIDEPHRPAVSKMSDEVLKSHVIRLNGTPDEISSRPFLVDYFLPILKADFDAVDRWEYRPKAPLPVPITAFMGKDDPTTSVSEVLAWREHTKRDFCMRTFPGDHFFIKGSDKAVVGMLSQTLAFFEGYGS